MAVDCDVDLLDLLERYGIRLKRIGKTYRCACPLHGGDNDQAFSVYLTSDGRWRWHCWTRCGDGDAIEFVMRYEKVGFRKACDILGIGEPPPVKRPLEPAPDAEPPPDQWRGAMVAVTRNAAVTLWGAPGRRALDYLRGRGFTDETIRRAGLGWSSGGVVNNVAIPAGVTIPYWVEGKLWRVTVRRLDKEPRYHTIAQSGDAPFVLDDITGNKPIVLVEGAFDALAVWQAAGDLVQVAGIGVSGCRKMRWLVRIFSPRMRILAFDDDLAGDSGAEWWQSAYPDAKRWRPTLHDPAEMLEYGGNDLVRSWIEEALRCC